MKTYHKIQTVFERDPATKHRTLLLGKYATPEFAYLATNEWVFTEKVGGTNIRVMFDGEGVTFGGKSDNAQIPAPLVKALESAFLGRDAQFAEAFPDGVCFYGEGYGAKIQKGGGNYRPDQSFVLFDVRVGLWWLQRKDVEQIGRDFGCGHVPVCGTGPLSDMVAMVKEGFSSFWGNFRAEGIVARPAVELMARNGSRIITKIKHKDFGPTRRG
jgi:hypothetical protein